MTVALVVGALGVVAVFAGLVLAAAIAFGALAALAAGLVVGGAGLFAYAELVLSTRKPKAVRR